MRKTIICVTTSKMRKVNFSLRQHRLRGHLIFSSQFLSFAFLASTRIEIFSQNWCQHFSLVPQETWDLVILLSWCPLYTFGLATRHLMISWKIVFGIIIIWNLKFYIFIFKSFLIYSCKVIVTLFYAIDGFLFPEHSSFLVFLNFTQYIFLPGIWWLSNF